MANVGTLEVGVDINSGKATATFVKAMKAAGEAGGEALEDGLNEVETKQLEARLRLLRAKIEVIFRDTGVKLNFEGEFEKLNAELGLRKAKFEANQWDIPLTVFDDELKVQLAATERLIAKATRDREVEATIELETALFQAELEKIEANKLEVTVNLKDELARLEAAKLRRDIKANETFVRVGLNLDTADVNQLRLYRQLQEANAIKIKVKPKIDPKNKFKKGDLGKLPSDMTKVFLGLGLVAGDALVSGIAGALAAGTAVISSAAQGIAGAIVPSVAILGGLAGVLGAVVVGSQGFGDALGAVNKELEEANEEGRDFDRLSKDIQTALSNLAPEAADVAIAFAKVRVQVSGIRKEVQGNLFSGLAKDIDALSDSSGKAESTIEDFGEFLGLAADSANKFVEGLIGIADSTDFATTFTSIQPAVDAILRTVLTLVATFEPFLQAAAPAAKELATYLSESADALNAWTSENAERISDILLRGVVSLEAWFGLLGNIGGLLADIFSAGQVSGDNFVVKLDEIITRFRVFLTDNDSSRLKDFFSAGEEAISALLPLAVGLKDALVTLTGEDAAESFRSLSEALGEFLPVFGDILLAIGQFELLQAALGFLVLIGQAIASTAELLGDFAPLVGTLVVSFLGLSKVVLIVNSLRIALLGLGAGFPPLFALTVALTGALVAYQYFSDSVSDATARTEELNPILKTNVGELIGTATAATAASVGIDALTASLLADNEQGEKLARTITLLNIEAADLLTIFGQIDEDTNSDQSSRIQALAELGGAFGITGDAALQLGTIVDEIDAGNLGDIDFGTTLRKQLQEIADATGLTIEEVQAAGQALEELQDQAENTDLNDLAKEFILVQGGATKVNAALLEQAEANTGLKRTGEDLFPLFEEFTELLALNNIELENAALALIEEAKELENTKIQTELAAIAASELARVTERELQAAIALTKDALGPLSKELQGTISKLEEGGKKAESFRVRLDALVPTAFGVEGALDGAQLAINELVAAIVTEEQAFVGFEDLLTGTSTAAIEQRTALRDTAAEIFSYAEAALEGGVGAGQAALKVDELSQSLVDQLSELELSADEIEELLVLYGLTPDQINTVFGSNAVQQKGVVDEYVGALNGTLLEIDTTFVADGLDPATGLTRRALENYELGLDDLNGRIVITDIQTPNIDGVTTGVNDLDIALDDLPPTTELFIEIPGLAEDIIGVNDLALAVVNLPTSKTIYVNTVFSSSGSNGSSSGSASDPSSPDFFSATAPSSTSNVTNHFNISGVSDAQAVATQVVNRTALAVM